MLPQTTTSQMDSQTTGKIEVPPNGEGLRDGNGTNYC
jgi:hypothetical protein